MTPRVEVSPDETDDDRAYAVHQTATGRVEAVTVDIWHDPEAISQHQEPDGTYVAQPEVLDELDVQSANRDPEDITTYTIAVSARDRILRALPGDVGLVAILRDKSVGIDAAAVLVGRPGPVESIIAGEWTAVISVPTNDEPGPTYLDDGVLVIEGPKSYSGFYGSRDTWHDTVQGAVEYAVKSVQENRQRGVGAE